MCVRPWSISFGQIGVKQSALLAKVPSTPLSPQMMAPALRAEEREQRREERAQQQRGRGQPAADGGDQRQAGPGNDEAASDPTSTNGSTSGSSSSASRPQSINDDTVLQDLMDSIQEYNFYGGGVDTSPKRGGEMVDEEVQSPSKVQKAAPRKVPRLESEGHQTTSTSMASGSNVPQPDGEAQVRMVVAGELLEDGDADLELPDQPPELSPDELFELEAKSIETEIKRLVDMGVLMSADGADLGEAEKLSTRFVMDWRWRDNKWQRRARLVARDYAWINPNRTDTFAFAGGQSLLRLVPCIAQLNGWKVATLDVKDAYLMCPQKKLVRVTVEKEVAETLNIPRDWLLGRVLPGQQEGASEWFQHLKGTLKSAGLEQCVEAPTVWGNKDHTITLLIHVDDLIVTGTDMAMEALLKHFEESYKVSVETGEQVNFLKRMISKEDGATKIRVNEKYLDGLVTLFGGVKKKRALGEVIVDEKLIEDEAEVSKFRSGVGTLLYISGDRPDIQFHTKELASKLSKPTVGSMATLVNVIGYLLYTKDIHLVMDGNNPSRSFRSRARGLTTAPEYEENQKCWLLEVATDSDWSGNKTSRSSTTCGCVFVGGNWVYSFSRTQKNITLSSTESEYVALVAGASEGLLLRAVLTHLVGPLVEMKLYADNSSAVAIAAKEGVAKIKHLSGKLLSVQQRQGRDFQLRKIDTITNVSDIGTKSLSGKRIKLLLYLMNCHNDAGDLGVREYEEECEKKEKREQLKSIRAVIHHEVAEAGEQRSSTLMNKVAKRLMRLTLAALLADAGQALSLTDDGGCLAMVEPVRPATTAEQLNYFLVFLVMALTVLLGCIGYKAHNFRSLAMYRINMVREIREILRLEGLRREQAAQRRRNHRRITEEDRAARIARLGVELREEAESEDGFSDDAETAVEATIRSVRFDGYEQNLQEEQMESENEMAMDEPVEDGNLDREALWGLLDGTPPVHSGGDTADGDGGADADVESADGHEGLDSISVLGAGYDNEEPEGDEMQEDEEEEEEDYASTDYGSVELVNEDFDAFESLEHEPYDDYRFQLLGDARGVEHYVVKQLAWLRRLPVSEFVWNEIRDLMALQKSVQLGGPSVRKRAINYLMGRRRYEWWYRMGRINPGERHEENELPDEWAAIHYGWGHSTGDEGHQPGEEEDSWSASERAGEDYGEEENERAADPPVDDGLGSSTDRPAGGATGSSVPTVPTTTGASGKSGGKNGGKGRNEPDPKDPPAFDEFDGRSTTACVASLHCDKGVLDVANLGDSGALVVQRDGKVILETKEQQHYFNCPYQLVCLPVSQRTGLAGGDLPASSDTYTTQAQQGVRIGDILVFATDGFFDNVFKDKAVDVITEMATAPVSEIATQLVQLAYQASKSLEESPFGTAAASHGTLEDGVRSAGNASNLAKTCRAWNQRNFGVVYFCC
eukprot:s351_g9.t1